MQRFKAFAIRRPFLFGLLLIFIYSLLSTLSYPVHFLFPDSETGQLLGDALSRVIVFLYFLYLLWRFGWIGLSGIKKLRLGWMKYVIALILLYKIAAELYTFTGSPGNNSYFSFELFHNISFST